jgi:HORMA domain-containing protein
MSTSSTKTTTYTVADIRKVVENFAADFSMMAQATGLRTRENVQGVVSDLNAFANAGYLEKVTLVLKDSGGNRIRGAVYNISDSATGWKSESPGNNLWPYTPGGALNVTATLSDAWWGKDDKDAFIALLNGTWPSGSGTSLAGMSSSAGQKYASNGYGWERTNYTN